MKKKAKYILTYAVKNDNNQWQHRKEEFNTKEEATSKALLVETREEHTGKNSKIKYHGKIIII